ncbi:MAG: ATP-binding cassette domain-containing protein [Bacteroidetes bacterium]|nr:ATP-binding cassette domain-containing protein [Bacteroidota bacterium]
MLHLVATRLGKQYGNQWILRQVSLDIPPGRHLAVTGVNGSGKSTLLKLLAGAAQPSEGSMEYTSAGKKIPVESVYRHISWAAPYVQPPLQLKLDELYALHFRFRPCRLAQAQACLEALELARHTSKRLSELSSGLLQRAQLGLALFTDTPVLLLDEPTGFLDEAGRSHMLRLIGEHSQGRTLLLASNDPREYAHISARIQIVQGRVKAL